MHLSTLPTSSSYTLHLRHCKLEHAEFPLLPSTGYCLCLVSSSITLSHHPIYLIFLRALIRLCIFVNILSSYMKISKLRMRHGAGFSFVSPFSNLEHFLNNWVNRFFFLNKCVGIPMYLKLIERCWMPLKSTTPWLSMSRFGEMLSENRIKQLFKTQVGDYQHHNL